MADEKSKCVACGRSSDEVPLVLIESQGQRFFICPQDLPVLIHQPIKLAGKLPGVEKLAPHEH